METSEDSEQNADLEWAVTRDENGRGSYYNDATVYTCVNNIGWKKRDVFCVVDFCGLEIQVYFNQKGIMFFDTHDSFRTASMDGSTKVYDFKPVIEDQKDFWTMYGEIFSRLPEEIRERMMASIGEDQKVAQVLGRHIVYDRVDEVSKYMTASNDLLFLEDGIVSRETRDTLRYVCGKDPRFNNKVIFLSNYLASFEKSEMEKRLREEDMSPELVKELRCRHIEECEHCRDKNGFYRRFALNLAKVKLNDSIFPVDFDHPEDSEPVV